MKTCINLELSCQKEFGPFFLNTVNISSENGKVTRRTRTNLMNTAMKDTFKKVFSDISSAEYKTVPAIKKEVETVNFNWYLSTEVPVV